MSEERLFTVEDANALLPEVSALVERLRDAQRTMGELHDDVMAAAPGNGGGPPAIRYLEASRTAQAALALLEKIGIVVRDPESGLIDFPAERDGQRVYLCWRIGEPSIAWWHPTDTGFAGRQPL